MTVHDLILRDMIGVVAVADHGHFGRAAVALRVAQPTLSAQVRKVETALGATLFERTGRTFLITPEGERLLPRLREVLAASAALASAAPLSVDRVASPLRLGVIPTLGPYLMPHLLLPLKRRRCAAPMEVTEQTTAQLLDALHNGSLDVAIISLPVSHQSLATILLFDEPFRLIAPRGHALLSLERLSPTRLVASEMILLEEGHCLREQAIAVCSRRGGVAPRVVTTSLETLKYLVATEAGYSLLPELACALSPGLDRLVQVRGFDERPPARRIALCFRRTLTRRAEVAELAKSIRANLPRGVTAAS